MDDWEGGEMTDLHVPSVPINRLGRAGVDVRLWRRTDTFPTSFPLTQEVFRYALLWNRHGFTGLQLSFFVFFFSSFFASFLTCPFLSSFLSSFLWDWLLLTFYKKNIVYTRKIWRCQHESSNRHASFLTSFLPSLLLSIHQSVHPSFFPFVLPF